MNSEEYAFAEIDNLNEILEDVRLSRSGHKSIIHSTSVVKHALTELKHLRGEMLKLENTISSLRLELRESKSKNKG